MCVPTLKIYVTNNFILEQVVYDAIQQAKAKLDAAEQEAREKNKTGGDLSREINTLKQQNVSDTAKHDRSISGMKSHLKTCHIRVKELEGNLQVGMYKLTCVPIVLAKKKTLYRSILC